MGNLDNDVRAELKIEGMKESLDRGRWPFPPPPGYIEGTDSNGKKTILRDPRRASLVTEAFKTYATGLYSKQQLLDIVNRKGLNTRNEKRLSGQTFCQLLRKPRYAGILSESSDGIKPPS